VIRRCAACGAANRVHSIPNFAIFRGGVLIRQQPGVMGHRQLETLALAP